MSDSVDINDLLTQDLESLRLRVVELEALLALRKKEAAERRSVADREKLEAVGRLTEGLCHEILNPLNVILLLVHGALDNGAAPPDIVEHFRSIEKHAHDISDFIKGLVVLSSRREPQRQPVDLNEMLRSLLRLKEAELKKRNITVELKLEEALPPVVLDWEQLGQVVLHLVNTASGSMPEGGRLVLSTKVACESGRLFAKLRLEDTGVVPSPEARDKLFEPFFSTGPEGQGMCLGLTACRSIVEAHRGSFKAEVGLDRWVAFTIKLPLRGEGRPFRRLADSIIPLK